MNAINKYVVKKNLAHKLSKTASMEAVMKALQSAKAGAGRFLGTTAGKATAGAAGLGLAGLAAKKMLGKPTAGQAAMAFVKKHKMPLAAGGAAGLGLAALSRKN